MKRRNSKSLPIAATIAVVCFLCGPTLTTAADDAVGNKTLIVQVIDQAGKPVKGASVTLSGEKPKSDTRWAEGMTEPCGQSDEQGNVSISYYANPYPNEAPPGLIRLVVQYQDGSFLCTQADLDAQQPVKLIQKTSMELVPIPITGVTFSDVIADLEIDQWPGDLRLQSSSNHPSIKVSLPPGTYRVRFTARTAEGKSYYSDLTEMSVNLPSDNVGEQSAPNRSYLPYKTLRPAKFLCP
jgi:hypothetical protein